MSSDKITSLPYTTIQPDWASVVEDVCRAKVKAESFWVSCYDKDTGTSGTIHGAVRINQALPGEEIETSGGIQVPQVTVVDGIDATLTDMKSIHINCQSLGIAGVDIHSAASYFQAFDKASTLRCFDVSPGEELVAVGGVDGALRILYAAGGIARYNLAQTPAIDLTVCRFFPSGQVLLTGGADMRLHVWSATDGSHPVTLIGHTGEITDVAMVGRGRTVYSSSADGTVRLWELASSKTLHEFDFAGVKATCLSLDDTGVQMDAPSGESTLGTEGILGVGLADGQVKCFDTRIAGQTMKFGKGAEGSSGVSALALSDSNHSAAVGMDDGVISVYDMRAPTEPVFQGMRNGSRINSLEWMRRGSRRLLFSTDDGATSELALSGQTSEGGMKGHIRAEWSGSELECVYNSKVRGDGHIWTASRDGIIRRFM